VGGHEAVTPEPTVLLDASNLHTGGAVQVAASFLNELADIVEDQQANTRWPFLASTTVHASTQVASNVRVGALDHLRHEVRDRCWRDLRGWRAGSDEYTVRFVLFGPAYGRDHRARVELMGCADGLALLPLPAGVDLSRAQRSKLQVKRWVWRAQLRNRVSVVESEALARRIVELGAPAAAVHVVPNSPHDVFAHESRWRPVAVPPREDGEVRLAYVARGHLHKNHSFLGGLARHLSERHGIRVRFVVTLTDDELARMSDDFRRVAVNLGELPIEAVPSVYRACDGTVFPSLLESFSVTPLEALAIGSPLLASDRWFVRDLCGDAATYVDPLDAASAAEVVARWWRDEAGRLARSAAGHALVSELPTARQRAERYLDLITGSLAQAAASTATEP
jgi:glycosyltransferase involved in cell wall biosynthesis